MPQTSAAQLFSDVMRTSKREGLTLIEVLLSLIILFATTLVVIQSLSTILRIEQQSQLMGQAIPTLATLQYHHLHALNLQAAVADTPDWSLEEQKLDRKSPHQLYQLSNIHQLSLRIPVWF